MSEVRVEQIESFLGGLGLDKTDFENISKNETSDFEPYVSKIRQNIQDSLMADTSFVENITKPFKDLPIGKENQLKKQVRKTFGLTFSEDELKKTSFEELLTRAKETVNIGTADQTKNLQEQLTEYMEKYETLKDSIPSEIQKTEQKWQEKFNALSIREELMTVIASETQVKKENLPNFTTVFLGFVNQNNLKIQIDSKKMMKLVDLEGNPAKNNEGGLLKIKDMLKTFGDTMNMNVAPRGTADQNNSPTINRDLQLLNKMGVGLSRI